MKLMTEHLGEIDYQAEDQISFKEGIPGFESEKTFVLIPSGDDALPFHYLQSTASPDLAFVVTDPFLFHPGYDFNLPDGEAHDLEFDSDEDLKSLLVLSIVTIPEVVEQATMNLAAPVIINMKSKKGKQVLLSEYDAFKYPLFQEQKGEV